MDHLYTRVNATEESDEIERWIQREFEDPAEKAIRLAVEERQMTKNHFVSLVRFFALQDLRTIKNYLRTQEQYRNHFQENLGGVVKDLIQRFEQAKREGRPITPAQPAADTDNDLLGLTTHVSTTSDHPGMGQIRVEMTAGRNSWLHSLLFILKRGEAVRHLVRHKWTILTAPQGTSFMTSDHPVVKLGFDARGLRNLTGGWGAPQGGVLMMPISPRHLLYTEIGQRPPARGTEVPTEKVHEINNLVAANALRFIYSHNAPDMSGIRQRHVDAAAFKAEQLDRAQWHQQQTAAFRA